MLGAMSDTEPTAQQPAPATASDACPGAAPAPAGHGCGTASSGSGRWRGRAGRGGPGRPGRLRHPRGDRRRRPGRPDGPVRARGAGFQGGPGGPGGPGRQGPGGCPGQRSRPARSRRQAPQAAALAVARPGLPTYSLPLRPTELGPPRQTGVERRSVTGTLGCGVGIWAALRDDGFTAYVAGRRAHLFRTAYLLCGDPHRAEDIVQTALAKLYVAWPRASRADSVDAYVRRVIINSHLDERRRPWRRESPTEDERLDRAAPAGSLPRTPTRCGPRCASSGRSSAAWSCSATTGACPSRRRPPTSASAPAP